MTKAKLNRVGSFLAVLSVTNYIFITSFGLVVLHSPVANAQTPPQQITVCTNIGGSTPAEAQVICANAGTVVVGRAPAPDYYFTFGNQLPDLLEAPPSPPYILTYNLGPGAMGGGIKCPRGYRCTVSWTADGYQITSDLVPKIQQNDSEWARRFWQRVALRAAAGPAAGGLWGLIAGIAGIGLAFGGAGTSAEVIAEGILGRLELNMLQLGYYLEPASKAFMLAANNSTVRVMMLALLEKVAEGALSPGGLFGNSSIQGLNEAAKVYAQAWEYDQIHAKELDTHELSELDPYNKMVLLRGTVEGRVTYIVYNEVYLQDGLNEYSLNGVTLPFSLGQGAELMENIAVLNNMHNVDVMVSGNLLQVVQWGTEHGLIDALPFIP